MVGRRRWPPPPQPRNDVSRNLQIHAKPRRLRSPQSRRRRLQHPDLPPSGNFRNFRSKSHRRRRRTQHPERPRNFPLSLFRSHEKSPHRTSPPANPQPDQPSRPPPPPGPSFPPKSFRNRRKLNPVDPPAKIEWKADPPELGSFSNGTFTAKTPGTGKIIAAVQAENGSELTTSQKIRVIDNPVKLRIDPSEISGRTGETIDLKVTAIDIRGYSAPLKPDDLEWQISGNIGKIETGAYKTGDKAGSGALIVKFGNLTGAAPIAIGSKPEQIAAFRKPEDWFTATAPEQTTCDLTFIDDPALIRDEGP